jgi:hypothetical protein
MDMDESLICYEVNGMDVIEEFNLHVLQLKTEFNKVAEVLAFVGAGVHCDLMITHEGNCSIRRRHEYHNDHPIDLTTEDLARRIAYCEEQMRRPVGGSWKKLNEHRVKIGNEIVVSAATGVFKAALVDEQGEPIRHKRVA